MSNPRELAEERLKLADQYAKLGERLAELKILFAEYYKTFRSDYKSDAGLERAWDLTKDGIEMEMIKLKMKTKQMKMSALRTLLEVAESERKNQY